jgi:hypothetical protein
MMVNITFWTLNLDLPPSKLAEVAAKLMQKGLWPVKGTKLIGFYICPGGRGVTITEGGDADTDMESFLVWDKELPGIFVSYETASALPAEKAIEMVLK